MELLTHQECGFATNNVRNEQAIFNLLGEFLSITLEKQDVEIIVESDEFVIDNASSLEVTDSTTVKVDFEEVVETDETLVVTVSGSITDNLALAEDATFTLFFELSWDNRIDAIWKRGYRIGLGTNSLLLHFGRKSNQLADSVFKVNLYREELHGRQYDLGQGKGFLLFGRGDSKKLN